MRVELNINDIVIAKLTPAGKEYLQRYYDDLYRNIRGVPKPVVYDNLSCPLWELMQIFGSQMFMGSHNQMFVDNRIEVV